MNDLIEIEKRYSDEAKAYALQNNQLIKHQSKQARIIYIHRFRRICRFLAARKSDESRVKQLEDSLKSKGAIVYRTHNEYVIKLREYNFLDQLYLYKIRNLLNYHQSIECLLNRAW